MDERDRQIERLIEENDRLKENARRETEKRLDGFERKIDVMTDKQEEHAQAAIAGFGKIELMLTNKADRSEVDAIDKRVTKIGRRAWWKEAGRLVAATIGGFLGGNVKQ